MGAVIITRREHRTNKPYYMIAESTGAGNYITWPGIYATIKGAGDEIFRVLGRLPDNAKFNPPDICHAQWTEKDWYTYWDKKSINEMTDK